MMLPCGVIFVRVPSTLGERRVVVVAGDVRDVGRGELQAVVSEDVCAVHEAEVSSSVEHVEVDAAIGAKNIAQNYPLMYGISMIMYR